MSRRRGGDSESESDGSARSGSISHISEEDEDASDDDEARRRKRQKKDKILKGGNEGKKS